METVGIHGTAWLVVLDLLKTVWCFTQGPGRFLLAWKPVPTAFEGQWYGWVWRGAAAGQAGWAPFCLLGGAGAEPLDAWLSFWPHS